MTNLFSSYRWIDAEKIVRENIDRNYVDEDLDDLIAVLKIIHDLRAENPSNHIDILDQNTERRIQRKAKLTDLLTFYGYEFDGHEYGFEIAKRTSERDRRRNGANEVNDLLTDLRHARNGSLKGFDEFLGIQHSRQSHRSTDHNQPHKNPFPSAQDIANGNAATLAVVKSFKQSLVSQHNPNPPPSFIRLRLARLLHKQLFPESRIFDEDTLDLSINHKVLLLKQNNPSTHGSPADDVCRECLIRTHFNQTEALKMLRDNPPNLEVPVEPAQPSRTPSMNSIVEPVRQHNRLITQQNNNDRPAGRVSQNGDRWESVKHIALTIQILRQKGANDKADDTIFSQMYRVVYAELLPILGTRSAAKIEMFIRQICDTSMDRVENLSIASIKDALTSGDDRGISDNFAENANRLLPEPCPTCLIAFPRDQMEVMFLCNHRCCLPCLKIHYRTAINAIQGKVTLNRLTCFHTPHPIGEDKHDEFFTYLNPKINQWFNDEPEVLRKYHEKTFEAEANESIKRCANPKCASQAYVDPTARITRVYCHSCDFAQCARCCRKWDAVHENMDCPAYEEWLFENDADNADVQAINYLGSNAIICPSCEEVFEYAPGGCEHYTCPNCQSDFCRMCYEFCYSPNKTRKCPHNDCLLKNGFHGHCKPNCFREIRDSSIDDIVELLGINGVDIAIELEKYPPTGDQKCITRGCVKETINDCGHRYCGACFKFWLCLLIWNRHFEPWTLYQDNNLQRILEKARIIYPPRASKADLIRLCQQHLNETMGNPKTLRRRRIPKPSE